MIAPELSSSVSERSVPVSSGSVNSGALSPALSIYYSSLRYILAKFARFGAILWLTGPLLLVFWAVFGGSSSVGRASRSQCEGRGFDPLLLHQSKGRQSFDSGLAFCLGSSVDRASAS